MGKVLTVIALNTSPWEKQSKKCCASFSCPFYISDIKRESKTFDRFEV